MYQKVMGRGEERVTQMKLSGRWHKQAAHVDWQEVSAMAASDSDCLEQACAGNTYLKHERKKEKMREEYERNPSVGKKFGGKKM